jgi:hypothetical protein
VRLEVTEAVLNHLSGSRAGVVGQRRNAPHAWSAHLLAAGEGRLPAGKVLLPFSRWFRAHKKIDPRDREALIKQLYTNADSMMNFANDLREEEEPDTGAKR